MNRKKKWGFLSSGLYINEPDGKPKAEPLNKNQFASWDSKKSNYERIDLIPKGGFVGGGGVYQTSGVTPTPTPTPSITPTNTPSITPSITPSNTPIILDCYWNLTDEDWNTNTNNWNVCQDVVTPTPTPSITQTMTPTPSSSPGPAFDADAAAYLEAVVSAGGTLDSTISGATDTLFTSLKSNGLYSKLKVFYPMIGGTSGSTAIMGNRVSGTTYDISWTNVGSITFNSSGVTGNGTTTLGDTNYNVYTEISSAAGAPSHLSVYVGTETNGNYGEIGVRGTSGNALLIAVDFSNTYYGWQYTQGGTSEFSFANSDATGMYVQSRTSQTSVKAFRNNVQKGHITLSEPKTAPNATVKILSDGSIYSNRRIQFVSIGEGLNDTEASNLTNIINTFQTTLGRNTY